MWISHALSKNTAHTLAGLFSWQGLFTVLCIINKQRGNRMLSKKKFDSESSILAFLLMNTVHSAGKHCLLFY